MNTRAAIGFALALLIALGSSPVSGAGGSKPEDVFKGKILVLSKRLPMRFSSAGAFVSALKSAKTDKLWPVEEKGDEHMVWKVEYIGFFAQPLNDSEITLKFWDITDGGKKFVATDQQYTRDRGARIFGASIELAKPEFNQNKKYRMTMESRGQTIASAEFWLRGKGPNYSGKVEFSESEAKQK